MINPEEENSSRKENKLDADLTEAELLGYADLASRKIFKTPLEVLENRLNIAGKSIDEQLLVSLILSGMAHSDPSENDEIE